MKMKHHRLHVVFCASEIAPFAKTGGLGDVTGALPPVLHGQGVKTSCFMPLYSDTMRKDHGITPAGCTFSVKLGAVPEPFSVYTKQTAETTFFFLRSDHLFYRHGLYGEHGIDYSDNARRFSLFSAACIRAAELLELEPDLFHVHDWQSALVPVYLHVQKKHRTPVLLTIHNLAYQGIFPEEEFSITGLPWDYYHWQRLEYYQNINFLKGGIVYADAVSTVSPSYSREIQETEYGCGLEGVLHDKKNDLYGILNGIDLPSWDPRNDPLIARNYHVQNLRGKTVCRNELLKLAGIKPSDKPLMGVITRLSEQKGLDILLPVMEALLKEGYPFTVLGTGDAVYETELTALKQRHPHHLGLFLEFNNERAHQIEAGSDIFLMPSRFEPCGLNQMYSMRYGTVPIVRATGGLKDSVFPVRGKEIRSKDETGFVFSSYDSGALMKTIRKAVALFQNKQAWNELMRNGMMRDFCWDRSAERYIELYNRLHKTSLLEDNMQRAGCMYTEA